MDQVVPLSRARRNQVDWLELMHRQHTVYILLEADVTETRRAIREYRTRAGEHISLTTFLTACFAHAVDEYRLLHAYRKGRGKLVIFEDVDVTVMVERELDREQIPLPFIIRGANHKNCLEIDQEIKAARTRAEPHSRAIRWSGPWLLVPAFMRRFVLARLLSNPQRRKRITGTTMLTNPGMFGNGRGWGISPPIYTASLVVGSIDTKPGVVDGKIEVREYLCLTLTVDHDIVDGAVAVRFTQRLKDLIESACLLDERAELGRLRC